MAIRVAFSAGIDHRRRGPADDDRQGVAHQAASALRTSRRISTNEGVADISHANWFGGIYQDPKNFFANMAVDPESWLRIYPEFQMPEEQKKAWLADRTGAIVGWTRRGASAGRSATACRSRGSIYRRPDGNPWEFTIDGIYDSTEKAVDKSQFFFHYDFLNETIRERRTGTTWSAGTSIKLEDPGLAESVAHTLDGSFANSPNETKTSTEKAFVAGFAKQIGDIGAS